MKLAGIIFLIAIIIYFFRSIRKNKNKEIEEKKIESKKEEEKKERNGDESKNKIWNKKSSYVWLFILQFVVLNFIYPGGWFEVKTLFWFFAQRNSDKYVAFKDINTILEKDEKQKISSVRVEIEKIKGKTKLTENDKRRLDELTNEITNVGKPTPPKLASADKPQEKVEWVMSFLVLDQKMEKEKEQENSYYEVPVYELISNDLEITITYKGLKGEKTTKLTRWNKNNFYGGWIENTHPKKRKGDFIFS